MPLSSASILAKPLVRASAPESTIRRSPSVPPPFERFLRLIPLGVACAGRSPRCGEGEHGRGAGGACGRRQSLVFARSKAARVGRPEVEYWRERAI
eukprot:scaffold1499_cov255-Pinguiococcus_pyrenoidosus.AAC.41